MPTHVIGSQLIPLSQILPNPDQPRKDFDPVQMDELKRSLQERGLINAISVVQKGAGQYMIIAGERRFRAVQELGWDAIDARIWPSQTPSNEVELMALVENLQRDDLNAIEIAKGYKLLSDRGMSQESIAKELGTSQSVIARYLALLDQPQAIQEIMSRDIIGEGHARYLSKIVDISARIKYSEKAEKEGWSVKDTEREVNKLLKKRSKKAKKAKTADEAPDPLQVVWVQAESFLTPGSPEPKVDYKDSSWVLTIPNAFENPKAGLSRYLKELAEGIEKAGDKIPEAPTHLPADLEKQADEARNLKRIPQTQEEWTELEGLAKGSDSPAAAYTWLYGADSPVVQRLSGKTWKDLEIQNPVQAVHDLVETVRLLNK